MIPKKWPTSIDLLAWYLFDKIQEKIPESADIIRIWIVDFNTKSNKHWHEYFQLKYEKFLTRFLDVDNHE